MKKAFQLYTDYKEHIDRLSDVEAGQLLKAILNYENGVNPSDLPGAVGMCFSFIRAQLDRSEEKYREKCFINSSNGKKGGRPKAEKQTVIEETERFSKKAKKADTEMNTETETDIETETNTEIQTHKKRTNTELFNRFWNQYPRKIAKQAAIKAWEKLNPSQELTERIIASILNQAATSQWSKNGGQYIPHPATFLNGRRWEDEIMNDSRDALLELIAETEEPYELK